MEEVPAAPARPHSWRELPPDAVERVEIRNILQQAVVSLPDAYQQVLVLRDIDELAVGAPARILNASTSIVKIRLHRARMTLQIMLVTQLRRESAA